MIISLYPFNKHFKIENETLLGEGRSSIINKFTMNDKDYIIKYFNEDYKFNNFKEFTYLNELFDNNLSYKCYGYNYKYISKNFNKLNNTVFSIGISIYDYIRGENIKEYLNKNSFDMEIYNKIIDYINFLHSKFILHNDLILNNIIISNENNEIKINIIDYGESYCYYNNKYISNYFINEEILNNLHKDKYNNENVIIYKNYKLNYNNHYLLYNLNQPCLDYLKSIKCIDKYNIFISIIIPYYLKNDKINSSIKTKIRKTRKLFYNIFSNIDNKTLMTDKLFKYFLSYNLSKRLNIPIYTFILLKYNKLSKKTLQQLYNIYNCIINDIDIIKILKYFSNNQLNLNSIYLNKNTNINDDIIKMSKYIENITEINYLYNLCDINIIILCIIHYTLNIFYRKINTNILLHFSYPFRGCINYFNDLSDDIKINTNNKKDINFDLILFNNLLLI